MNTDLIDKERSAATPLPSRAVTASPVGRAADAIRFAVRDGRWLILVVALQLISSALLCGLASRAPVVGLDESYVAYFAAAALFGAIGLVVSVFRRRMAARHEVPAAAAYADAWSSFRRDTLDANYLACACLALLLAPLAMSGFSAAKQAIPVIHPFSWDERIAAWRGALSGATTVSVLNRPAITIALDLFYHRIWTASLLAPFVLMALARPSPLRRRFLVAFVLVFFVVGNLLALLFSSAGPAYYGRVVAGGSDPYASLMAYLHAVDATTPLLSVRGQAGLWAAYVQGRGVFGWGISAMPSVHVGSAVLATLLGFEIRRWVGVVLAAAAVCTFVSSIALGWHYAMDGYVGAAAAALIWWLAGRMTRSSVP